MRFTVVAAMLAAAVVVPPDARAQAGDSLIIGDRVRVQVAANRGYTGVFIGNVAEISTETLVVEVPGGKARTTFPRAAIAEVAISDGRESRLNNVPKSVPFFALPIMIAVLPNSSGSHHVAIRNQRIALIGLHVVTLGQLMWKSPPERWRPVYSWLDR